MWLSESARPFRLWWRQSTKVEMRVDFLSCSASCMMIWILFCRIQASSPQRDWRDTGALYGNGRQIDATIDPASHQRKKLCSSCSNPWRQWGRLESWRRNWKVRQKPAKVWWVAIVPMIEFDFLKPLCSLCIFFLQVLSLRAVIVPCNAGETARKMLRKILNTVMSECSYFQCTARGTRYHSRIWCYSNLLKVSRMLYL